MCSKTSEGQPLSIHPSPSWKWSNALYSPLELSAPDSGCWQVYCNIAPNVEQTIVQEFVSWFLTQFPEATSRFRGGLLRTSYAPGTVCSETHGYWFSWFPSGGSAPPISSMILCHFHIRKYTLKLWWDDSGGSSFHGLAVGYLVSVHHLIKI
jgi:hypothetical protein